MLYTDNLMAKYSHLKHFLSNQFSKIKTKKLFHIAYDLNLNLLIIIQVESVEIFAI